VRADVTIAEPELGHGADVRAILDELPTWFGIPESNDAYVAFVDAHPTWRALGADGRVIGVLAPHRHNPHSVEIHLLAVVPEHHRTGVGRALVDAFERAAREGGAVIAHVKTLGPSDPDEGYAKTREFYLGMGYVPMEEMVDLWPGNPALLMVKPLIDRPAN
jgi:GNAT superfamily N-acetyltransferase